MKDFVVVGEEEGLHPTLAWFVHFVTNYILYIEGLWDVLPAPSCLHPRNSEITFSSSTCTCIYVHWVWLAHLLVLISRYHFVS